jgi:type VI secretion system protein VasG
MFLVELKSLLSCLNQPCFRALEAGLVLAQSRRHPEVEIEHVLLKLTEEGAADIPQIFAKLGLSLAPVQRALQNSLEKRSGSRDDRPEFSPYLAALIQDSWLLGSLELRAPQLRSAHLLLLLLRQPQRYKVEDKPAIKELLGLLNPSVVRGRLDEFLVDSSEEPPPDRHAAPAAPVGAAEESGLNKYTLDLTAEASAGRLDAVTGRDQEIEQLIGILSRRRKNPLLVGEAGVGKTALVEGLALRIAKKQVQDWLKDVTLRNLDLGLLQAGAGMRGEFEARLTSIIREAKESPKPTILFIDEAHMLIGAGNQAGTGDAANLLKPALARGELRVIAATTWVEFKKYFEKDTALRRRFQMIKVDEPSLPTTVAMLNQLKSSYMKIHGVHIQYEALETAAQMASRYLSGRQLPDKAVDLIDRCAAYVKLRQAYRPAELERTERQLEILVREQEARERDLQLAGAPTSDHAELGDLLRTIDRLRRERQELADHYEKERQRAEEVLALRSRVNTPNPPSPEELQAALAAYRSVQKEVSLVPIEVDPEVVAAVVAEETNIPVGRIISSDAAKLESLEQHIEQRVKGQAEAIKSIANRIRSARTGMQDPKKPIGVFLLVGPSGTGKTETALAVAELLFGSEQFLTTINMSEYMEEHAVSRLIGAPPGYVGYEEGGVLTDAVRQRPYSVILLDEVEKAKPRIMNLFYQVFDRGMLADGQGRVVDFSNTVIFMTSNLGSQLTMELTEGGKVRTSFPELEAVLRRRVLKPYFSPALLARMTVLPYYPLAQEILEQVLKSKLEQVRVRVEQRYHVKVNFAKDVHDRLMAACTDVESGARVIDHLIREELIPTMTSHILARLSAPSLDAVSVTTGEAGRFVVAADDPEEQRFAARTDA